jgi:hypothetical protein
MPIDLLLAQMIMEERVKDTLREAEQARLVRTPENSKRTGSFLLAGIQFIRDWWSGGNGRHQPTMDNMRPQKRPQNLGG